jgi:D-alanyl-D-alanine dipeptidase
VTSSRRQVRSKGSNAILGTTTITTAAATAATATSMSGTFDMLDHLSSARNAVVVMENSLKRAKLQSLLREQERHPSDMQGAG